MEFEIYNTLFTLVKNQKWDEFVKNLDKLDDQFDVNIRDDSLNYLLTYSIIFNQPHIVKMLLDRHAKIDMIDSEGFSVLYIPIKYRFDEILNILLKYDEETIGISILDIKDKTDKIALHYAIIMKNEYAVKVLLENGSNANMKETTYGYNALHLGVKSRNYNICKEIVKYIDNMNDKCNTGESALHIACNFQLYEIVELLIQNKININIQDFNNEISALHYCVHLNNKNLINLLLKNNADINVQDSFGNTPVHYTISENNYEIFILLINSSNNVNLNLWNLNGEIALHILLKLKFDNVTDYLDILLEKSNLTLQDTDGNTCLHYLIMLGLWNEYTTILSKKRLNIIIKNIDGKMPVDLVKPKDYNDFINMVEESYYIRLQDQNNEWMNTWENICSVNFNKVDKKMLQELGNNVNEKNFKNTCKSIIHKKIIELINNAKNGTKLKCTDQTFPMKKIKQCVDINAGTMVDIQTFTGNTLDVLIGLIYLLEKHGNTVCSTLTKNFTYNKQLCNFYRNLGIIVNNKCEFLNFEIIWLLQHLYLPENFFDSLKNCINKSPKSMKFIIIPLGIINKQNAHANYLIYDLRVNQISRFETHGHSVSGMDYNALLLDEILKNKFKTFDENIKYITPDEYLPRIGFQLIESYEKNNKRIGDVQFCALWSIYFVDQQLTYEDIPREKLVKLLIENIRKSNISFRNLIRNYSKNITNIRDDILKRANIDINDWSNEQYTDKQIDSVMTELNNKVRKLIE